MITGVRVKSIGDSSSPHLNLPIFGYGKSDSLYQILYIDGLTPSPVSITTQDRALRGGVDVLGARSQARNLVLTVGFPQYGYKNSLWKLREELYRYFPTRSRITLLFDVVDPESPETKVFTTEGYVETFEANIFGEEPKAQVSILCPDPYFYDSDRVVESLEYSDRTTWRGQTAMPIYAPEIFTEETGLNIVYGAMQISMGIYTVETVIDGETESTFEIDLNDLEDIAGFEICSVFGQRRVELLSLDGRFDLLGRTSRGEKWPSIGGGREIYVTPPSNSPIEPSTYLEYEFTPKRAGL